MNESKEVKESKESRESKEAKEAKDHGIGPGRRKTVRKGMFSRDCKAYQSFIFQCRI